MLLSRRIRIASGPARQWAPALLALIALHANSACSENSAAIADSGAGVDARTPPGAAADAGPFDASFGSDANQGAPDAGVASRRFGFSSHVPDDPVAADAYVARLAGAGATLLRDGFPWAWSEPRQGSINFSRADRIAGLARKYGMKVVFQIGFTPRWANGGRQDKVGPTAEHIGDWVHWAAAVAGYMQEHHRDVVVGLEYWNEPNIQFLINPATGQAGDAAYYATLVNAAYPAMKAAGPDIPVWAGSTAGVGSRRWDGPLDWTEDVLMRIGDNFDAWSCHPYYFATGITAQQATRLDLSTGFSRSFWSPGGLESLDHLLERYGYTGPIHATEIGVPTDTYPAGTRIADGGFGTTSESEQAAWFPLAWELWTSQPRAGHFAMYTGQDRSSSDTSTRESHFGAFRSDGSAKPIVDNLRALLLP